MSTLDVPTHELTRTFGVLLIGFIISVVLYGLTFFQTYIYFTRFPHDGAGTKAIVGLLWAIDTVSTTLVSHTIYHYLITNFALAFTDLTPTKTFVIEEGLTAGVVLIVQAFYVYRLWSVANKQLTIPAVIIVLAIASCGLDLGGVVQMSKQTFFATMVTNEVKLLRGVGFALAVVTDLSILGAMFYHMQPTRNPGMAVPNGWYEKIVVYGFNRGTAFTITQTLSMIFFLALPRQQAWVLLNWLNAKVYVNSILAMLNFRNLHRGRGVNEEDSLNQHASNRSNSNSAPTGPRDTTRSVQFSVHPDAKNHDPMNIIELDMVPSHMEGYDDDSAKHGRPPSVESGPSKRKDFDD